MAGSIFCRKCLGVEAEKLVAVSRVGPSTRPPSTSASNSSAHPPVAIIVFAVTVSALLCLCIVVLVLQNIRRRRSVRANMSSSGSDAQLESNPEPTDLRKSREGDDEEEAACSEGPGRRSTQRVEQLVVMAGEDRPTFLAHPVPAPSMAACNLHIQCPPLHL